jgi:hypothetical protein
MAMAKQRAKVEWGEQVEMKLSTSGPMRRRKILLEMFPLAEMGVELACEGGLRFGLGGFRSRHTNRGLRD